MSCDIALLAKRYFYHRRLNRDNGTKQFIQILLLLEKYSIKQIAKALTKALNHRVYCYDGIFQFLLTSEDYAFTSFSLAGREHLRSVTVNTTKVSAKAEIALPDAKR